MRLVFLVLCLLPWLPLQSAPPAILATLTAPYLEDEHGKRVVAEVDVELRETDTGVHLRGRIRATGGLVDAVPGFAGIHGGNRITAREMTTLHEQGALALTDPHGHPAGTIRAGRPGRIAERHVRADGTLDDGAASEPMLVELRFDAGPFGLGEHELWLRANEIPRLRIAFTVGTGRAEITNIEGTHEHAR